MTVAPASYGERAGVLPHTSFFRRLVAARSRPVPSPLDPVEEHLIDQANLRGFLGAFSDRSDLGPIDPELGLEDIVVGLLMPHAPADLRVVKLIVRILQHGVDVERLVLRAKRERALSNLAWLVSVVPPEERLGSIERVARHLADHPARDPPPRIRYSADRLRRPRR